jgi:hypothetical protein
MTIIQAFLFATDINIYKKRKKNHWAGFFYIKNPGFFQPWLKELEEKRREREKRRMEKMRALGAEFVMAERKRKLKKKLRKRKRELKGTDGTQIMRMVHKTWEWYTNHGSGTQIMRMVPKSCEWYTNHGNGTQIM